MAYLIEKVNGKYAAYLAERRKAGCTSFAFCGGRRSGKTFFIAQFLTTRAYMGEVVNVASMTQSQGRLGAYSDFVNIIRDHPTLDACFECLQSPLEIRNKWNDGRIIFNSYQKGMTAKGIACDWLFLNEANAFDKLQVASLRANVRKGWIIDYNPDSAFWVDDYFQPDDICHSTWRDNPFLTPTQLEWFDELKRNAERPNASSMDRWLYRVYYCGEPAELSGSIFTRENISFVESLPPLWSYVVFCDPSDLRGADYFACVLCATDGERMVVVDSWSQNVGDNDIVLDVLRGWRDVYALDKIMVETNGSIGQRFFEYATNSGVDVVRWWSKGNKFERITSNYQDIVRRVVFADTARNREYVEQVYRFDAKCEHDDNIDAVNSAINYFLWSRLFS